MKIDIITPEKSIFSGEAKGIVLPGTSGYFELLDKHAPLIASLKEGTIKLIGTDDKSQNMNIKGGFVECINNTVSVMVEGVV
jgi:F-type H+-transporting ATPase subunit epsilon